MYLNELAPWERKNEYFKVLELGKDVRQQSEIIRIAGKKNLESQLRNADRIIASQQRMEQHFEELSKGLHSIAEGMADLKSTFEWGISEIVWQLEQNRAVMRSIEEGVWSPFDAQARNRKKQAEQYYAFGWIDEAEEYFIESEKIVKADFSVHISLGIIYIFHKIDKKKALKYFENAIKYSGPISPYHKSFSLMHKALILFDLGNATDAESVSDEAIATYPAMLEAHYQNAVYNAQTGNTDKALQRLEYLIKVNLSYVLKADSDPLLNPIRSAFLGLVTNLTRENYKAVQDKLASDIQSIHKTNNFIKHCEKELQKKLRTNTFHSYIEKINNLIALNTYLDSLAAVKEQENLSRHIQEFKLNTGGLLNSILYETETAKKNIITATNHKNTNSKLKWGNNFAIGGGILSFILGLKTCTDMLGRDSYNINKSFGELIGKLVGAPLVFFGILLVGIFIFRLIGKEFGRAAGTSHKNKTTELDKKIAIIKNLQKIYKSQ